MNDYVYDKSSEHDAENDRPKMPARNSFDLSTLPAISLAKKNMAKDNKNPSQTDKKDEKPEEKESGFMISKYLSEVHGNLPEDILLEIEKMVKEESFILDKWNMTYDILTFLSSPFFIYQTFIVKFERVLATVVVVILW